MLHQKRHRRSTERRRGLGTSRVSVRATGMQSRAPQWRPGGSFLGLGTGRSARECHWTPRPVAARRPALPRRHSGPKRDRTVEAPPETKPGPERGLGDLQARARFVPRAGKAPQGSSGPRKAPQGSSGLRGQPEAQGPRAQSPSHLPVPVGLGLGLRMVDGLWIHAGTGRCPSQWTPDGLHGFAVARVLFAARAPIVSAPRLRRSNLSGTRGTS